MNLVFWGVYSRCLGLMLWWVFVCVWVVGILWLGLRFSWVWGGCLRLIRGCFRYEVVVGVWVLWEDLRFGVGVYWMMIVCGCLDVGSVFWV